MNKFLSLIFIIYGLSFSTKILSQLDTLQVGSTQLILIDSLLSDTGIITFQQAQDTNGTITDISNSGSVNSPYEFRDTVTGLTPSQDYYFRAIFVSDTGSATDTTFWFLVTMKDTGDTSDPWYVPPEGTTQFTITLNITGSGSIYQSPSGITHDSGTVIHFTATADSGNRFINYSGSLSSSSLIDSIVLSSNINITATFDTIRVDSSRPNPWYRGKVFDIYGYNLSNNDQLKLGDTLLNGYVYIGTTHIQDTIPVNMPRGKYPLKINGVTKDSITVYVPKWGW